jgi:ubiquinone/menaquinone biosynthesis C-methylase UbiE
VEQNSPRVARYFQQRADDFDALYRQEDRWRYYANQVLRGGLYERVRLTLDEMRGLGDFSVLDVGCGSGRNSVLFAAAGAGRVVGADISPRMIELARQFSRRHAESHVCEFVQADFLQHDFRETFDVVVALGVFDYTSDPRLWLRKLITLVKRKVIVSFPEVSLVRAPLRKLRYALRNCPVYFYTRKQLQQLCTDTGLGAHRVIPYASSGLLLVGELNA